MKTTAMLAVVLFALLLTVRITAEKAVLSADADDARTLLALRSVWGDSAPSDWAAAASACAWSGVVCNDQGHVVELRLAGSGVSGPLPAAIGRLRHLRLLNLTSNLVHQLHGPIPAEVGLLSELEHLALGWNSLSGPIPAELGALRRLRTLDLHWNRLTGAVPATLAALTELRRLRLSANDLSGPLPPQLAELRKLEWLDVSANPRLTVPSHGVLADLASRSVATPSGWGPTLAVIGALAWNIPILFWFCFSGATATVIRRWNAATELKRS